MQVRILRRSIKRCNWAVEYIDHDDRLQFRVGDGFDWQDVPIIMCDESNVEEGK